MMGKSWVSLFWGIFVSLWTSLAGAVPVTITINDIELRDPDVSQAAGSPFAQYFVTTVRIGSTNLPISGIPHVGVCAIAPETDPVAVAALGGCQNHINPTSGMWSFTVDLDPALGEVDVFIQVRNADAAQLDPIDMSPGNPVPADRGLRLTIDPVNGTWLVPGDPTSTASPTTTQSSLIGADGRGPTDSTTKTARVNFDVLFCPAGIESCTDGTSAVCVGSACTTTEAAPQCNNKPGTISCNTDPTTNARMAVCNVTPLAVQELQNALDDDCDGSIDECNADQIGQTFECAGQVGACPMVPGLRTCEVADQLPGACVLPQDVCQPRCATEIFVTNVTELRAAVQQASLTDCKDVIVLAPGTYDVFDQTLAIDDSVEIRGQGSSFGCEGLDVAAFAASTLSPDLGSARCDGDDGEDPSVTVITSTRPVAADDDFRRVVDIGAQGSAPEVTLRHLTVRGGYSTLNFFGDEGVGIRSAASRLELYNVVVEDNVAPAPGAAIDHNAGGASGPGAPTFIMANSIVRENRCTTNRANGLGLQGDGGGMRLKGGSSFILRSAIYDNAALRGAGISAYSRLSIFNSTISGNVAGQEAAGIWFTTDFGKPPELLQLHHTTVTNNVAQWLIPGGAQSPMGAGIGLRFGTTAQLIGSVVAGNVTCAGDPTIRCDVDADCPTGATCQCRDLPQPNGECLVDSLCVGDNLFPPNLSRTTLCAVTETNCLALEEAGAVTPAFESWGGNVASSDCGVSPSFSLPSGVTTSDTVVNLQLSAQCSRTSTLQNNWDLFCYRGMRLNANVGGQISDPSQPAGPVVPPAGNAFVQNFAFASLVGPLADNGGPTPTHAVAANSLAAGASQTLADPGDTADAFPSTVPACPTTDQRGFASAAGERPLVCDAGAYQSAATSMLFADDLADELGRLSVDTDSDGIADLVDSLPESDSRFFSDSRAGGWTSGEIVSAGHQTLRIFDVQPNPFSGVVVIALSGGGTQPALVRACDGNLQLVVEAGEVEWLDCPQQPGACVVATEDLTVFDRAELTVPGVLGDDVMLGQAVLTSDVFATGDLVLQRTSIAGDAVASGEVVGAAISDVAGAVSEGAYLRRRTVATRTLSVGTTAVTVENDQSRTLAPGKYGSLTVGDRGRLRLSEGTYTFAGASFGHDAIVELSGFVQIATQSSLSTGDRVHMRTPSGLPASADLIEWYTNASTVNIGHDTSFTGTLLAPQATVTVRDRASVDGCLATRSLSLGHDSSVFSNGQLSLTVLADDEPEEPPSGGGDCTEASAVDLGAPGQQASVSTAGCVRVRDGYPSWWGTRQMKLETTPSGQYPVPFTWTNTCSGGSGSGSFTGDWQSNLLPGIKASCATLIDLQGSGAGNVTLRYWAQ